MILTKPAHLAPRVIMSWADQLASNRQMGETGQDEAVSSGAGEGYGGSQLTGNSAVRPVGGGLPENNAFALRKRVENAQAIADQRPEDPAAARAQANAVAERQDFWMDTCREASHRHLASKEILDFYQKLDRKSVV